MLLTNDNTGLFPIQKLILALVAVRIGEGCAKLHHATMRDVEVSRIELDEIWSYVGKKQRKVTPTDNDMVGDQYTFIALAGVAKAIITYRTGKRTRAKHKESNKLIVRGRRRGKDKR